MDFSFTTLSSAIVGSISTAGLHAQAIGAAAVASAQAVPAAIPGAINAGMSGTQTLARNVALVERPIAVAARGTGLSTIGKLAHGLGRVLPWIAIGASAASGAQVVQGGGYGALATTRQGRGAVLGAVGGMLLLAPIPPTQIAAAVVLGGIAANELGAFDRFDRPMVAPARAVPVAQQLA